MTSPKKLDIDALVGHAIVSYTFGPDLVTFECAGGARFEIHLEDDGNGTGNDSHAFFSGCDITPILGHVITAARHEDGSSYGVNLLLESATASAFLAITHEHNGYYGFSYEVVPLTP